MVALGGREAASDGAFAWAADLASRMSRATRFLPQRCPRSRNALVMRGLP